MAVTATQETEKKAPKATGKATGTPKAEKKKTAASKTAKKNLVIVESPSKAKTIGKFLGSKYKVIASVGHVRDLPKSKLGINIENDFEPEYINIRGKGDLIRELRKEAKAAGKIYLATDPDREGEAISWHLAYLLDIDEKEPCRIVFNEITKKAIQDAVKNPRPIDLKLVDAQQARRALDRLVGYQISPILWRKVRRGLSAGRVQSAALKIICDRENQIKAFVPKEYWNIQAMLSKSTAKNDKSFPAKLTEYQGKKLTLNNREETERVLSAITPDGFVVRKAEEKERAKKPYAPFTTSSLQQEASTRLNFYTKRTMQVAQQLYEGVEIKGHGTVGLVTYIRTDSVRISDEARAAAKAYITENFGGQYWGNNFYSNKKKEVQDAHEAIRPSHIEFTPETVKDSLSRDQYNLYRLIWSRFMASQMKAAVYSVISADIENHGYGFKASGSKLIFDGYLKVYRATDDEDESRMLPPLDAGDRLVQRDIKAEQNFTQPPARFTEASLIRDLEEKNIGRPSTYAPIVGTLTERKYVSREKKSLVPTELGFIVTDFMEKYFREIVDAGFTADMEDQLDLVEVEDNDWKDILRRFYSGFEKELSVAESDMEKVQFEDEPTGELCELCGRPMVKKMGRFGEFIACSGYPECKNTKNIVTTVDVKCPKCGKDIVVRRSKKGKVFYGCSGYPDCDQVFWYKPVDKKCPKCDSLLVERKLRGGTKYACSNSECDYKE